MKLSPRTAKADLARILARKIPSRPIDFTAPSGHDCAMESDFLALGGRFDV
jgi:hypothetical protein